MTWPCILLQRTPLSSLDRSFNLTDQPDLIGLLLQCKRDCRSKDCLKNGFINPDRVKRTLR